MSIAIFGAGAFGTALAVALAGAGQAVTLIARDPDGARGIDTARENAARLPGVPLPAGIAVTADPGAARGADAVLLSVPTQKLRALVTAQSEILDGKVLVACCKGVEIASGLGPTALLSSLLPACRPAMLTGPSFADDIARGLPTALTLACADDALGQELQERLSTPSLRLYRTTDTVGAELGGALKNVIAIACGAVMGARLGESARAALMTRGYAEMLRMALRQGARPETLAGLSGFGDLALTCTSDQSRNYRYGLALGSGAAFDASITVEGAATARAVAARAAEMQLDMPITEAVLGLVDGKFDVGHAIRSLLSRPLKEE